MSSKRQFLVAATIAASVLLIAPRVASAALVSFQQGVSGYAGTDDTMLASWAGAPSLSFGGRPNFDVGSFSTSSTARSNGLVRFDLTSLATMFPGGYTVNSATLRLTTSNVAFNSSASGNVQAILLDNANAGWVEGTSVGGAEASVSVWHRRLTGTDTTNNGPGSETWTGGSGAAGSDGGTVLGSAAMVTTLNTAIDIDLGASLSFIDTWASGGTNGGFYLRAEDLSASAGGRQSFFSSEDPTVGGRPELILDVTAIPEPSSFVLLLGALGMFAGLRCRK